MGRRPYSKEMRHLVIGAGASVAEAVAQNLPPDMHPPTISSFGRKLWGNFNPHPFLDNFLESIGYTVTERDGRPLFWELEENGITNVERLFEFIWIHRKESWDLDKIIAEGAPPGFIQGFFIYNGGFESTLLNKQFETDFLENFVYHGIKSILGVIISTAFFEQGKGFRNLIETRKVAKILRPGDLVLNLNYDTLFEIGLKQASVPFAYAPSQQARNEIIVCKPHGSLNLAVKEDGSAFFFGQPEWLGVPIPRGCRPSGGIIPPRLNKNYSEHPLARLLIQFIRGRQPRILTFWGVGLAESDADLLLLYRDWAYSSEFVELINPNKKVADRVKGLLYVSKIDHYKNVDEWVASWQGRKYGL